jgi:hypothetical protein
VAEFVDVLKEIPGSRERTDQRSVVAEVPVVSLADALVGAVGQLLE